MSKEDNIIEIEDIKLLVKDYIKTQYSKQLEDNVKVWFADYNNRNAIKEELLNVLSLKEIEDEG